MESLSTIKNKYVYKAVGEAISRYHAVLGVRQKEVKIATLERGFGGVHLTSDGKSKVVVLSKQIFNGDKTTTQSIAEWSKKRL